MTTQPLPSPEQIDAMADKVNLFKQYHRQAANMLRSIASHLRSHAGDAEDAKRYRWLRDIGNATWKPLGKRYMDSCALPHDVDAAIDGALKENSDER